MKKIELIIAIGVLAMVYSFMFSGHIWYAWSGSDLHLLIRFR